MADITIPQLNAATSVSGTDVMVISQAGVTKKVEVDKILSGVRSDLSEIETIVEQVKDGGLDDGSIELSKLSTTLAAYIGSGGEVTNQADDDDLENIIINGVPVVREKTTKTHTPETYSGMGRVILRKNMVNGVNVLTQEIINQANTVYEIRYDFDLNDAEITIPEGCVLDFQGGSLNNGSINSNYIIYIIDFFKGNANINSKIIESGYTTKKTILDNLKAPNLNNKRNILSIYNTFDYTNENTKTCQYHISNNSYNRININNINPSIIEFFSSSKQYNIYNIIIDINIINDATIAFYLKNKDNQNIEFKILNNIIGIPANNVFDLEKGNYIFNINNDTLKIEKYE